jgi:serine/threonine-protein kinase
MERLRGQTLREILVEAQKAGRGMAPVDAVYCAWQALEGLAVVHGAKIVHRDVKPENMMVDPSMALKLLDFGLALAPLGERREGDSGPLRLSVSGLMGTPRYVAPEVALHQGADPRSDLYAMGVVLVEMLTGEHVHPGVPRDPAALLRAHVEQAPVLQRDKSPDVPEEVWAVAARLLQKDPARRYPTAVEAREALTPFLMSRLSQLPEAAAEKVVEAHGAQAALEARRQKKAQAAAQAAAEPTARLAPGYAAPSPCAPRRGPAAVIQVSTLMVRPARPPVTVTQEVPAARASKVPAWVAKPRRPSPPAPVAVPRAAPTARPRLGTRRIVGLSVGSALVLWAVVVTVLMVREKMGGAAASATAPALTTSPMPSAAPTAAPSATAAPTASAAPAPKPPSTARKGASTPRAATPTRLPPLPFKP